MKHNNTSKKNNLTANIVIEIDYHSSRTNAVGTRQKYGGKRDIDEDSIQCPVCSGNSVKGSDFIGYIFCNDCRTSYPTHEFYQDIKKREQEFLKTVEEVKSNVDNLALVEELSDNYRNLFHREYVKPIEKKHRLSFFFDHKQYGFWIEKLKREKDDKTLKQALRAKTDRTVTRILFGKFLAYIRHKAKGERFNMDAATYVSKADLIRESKRVLEENRELKSKLKEYGIY